MTQEYSKPLETKGDSDEQLENSGERKDYLSVSVTSPIPVSVLVPQDEYLAEQEGGLESQFLNL